MKKEKLDTKEMGCIKEEQINVNIKDLKVEIKQENEYVDERDVENWFDTMFEPENLAGDYIFLLIFQFAIDLNLK